jgi:hypothetical protein
MRTISMVLLSLSLLAGRAAAAPSQPPATRDEAPQTRVVPFLGTATIEATPRQRAAAGLPEGIGLAVEHVLEGSPADLSGLKPKDVLHKLGDQILVNDPQFRVLLRTFRPGDEVRLTVLRDGQPRPVSVRLGERRVPVGDVPARELMRWMLMPPDAGTVTGLLEFTANYEDDRHVLVLACDAQGKRLLVKDKQGKTLFDGPVNTEAQRQSVPEVVRAKLKVLETPPKNRPSKP